MWKVHRESLIQYVKLKTCLTKVLKVLNFVVSIVHKSFFKKRNRGRILHHQVSTITKKSLSSTAPWNWWENSELERHAILLKQKTILAWRTSTWESISIATWIRMLFLLEMQIFRLMHSINSNMFSGWIQLDLFSSEKAWNTGRHNSRLWNSEPKFVFLYRRTPGEWQQSDCFDKWIVEDSRLPCKYSLWSKTRIENNGYMIIEDPYQESKSEWSECFE